MFGDSFMTIVHLVWVCCTTACITLQGIQIRRLQRQTKQTEK